MKYYYHLSISTLFMFALMIPVSAESQTIEPHQIQAHILELDSSFWTAYNTCELDNFKTFLTDDLEFYHDKGGLTETADKLMSMISEGLCGDKNSTLRREAIEGSVEVFPLNNYGAIISGEHRFYITENGQAERLTGSAKFTHIWKQNGDDWHMSRVLSYNHQEAFEK